MNGPVSALLGAAQRSLRDAVRPELRTDHARSQLAGVLDMLAKLERMTDWSAVMVSEELEALESGIAAVEARAESAGAALPQRPAAGDDRLLAIQDRARQLSDWIFDAIPDTALRDELDALLRACLRNAVAAERRHVPRTDFSSMTESKDE